MLAEMERSQEEHRPLLAEVERLRAEINDHSGTSRKYIVRPAPSPSRAWL